MAISGCGFDRADRWLDSDSPPPPSCEVGQQRCAGALERCTDGPSGPSWVVEDDCAAKAEVCAPTLLACVTCVPDAVRCEGQTVQRCGAEGAGWQDDRTCDLSQDFACRSGVCVHLCSEAAKRRSNVGCEYWAVDLDNARIDDATNAAAQQFAVVVSNAQPDLPARVTIEQDDGDVGGESRPTRVAEATLAPLTLRVFRLGPREVDGSAPGTFDTGTHSAHTRAAYRVRSSAPVVAYQFNPLENVSVFSNDASLLKPVEALGTDTPNLSPAYVALGWPQTIATTEDPATNFNPNDPRDLRAFLTIVGTRPDTRVRVTSTARIIGGGGVPATDRGEALEAVLHPFEVLNLETDNFNGDFSGSLIETTRPVAVFTGSEASDAPFFRTLSERRCCADHLEEQLDPIRTAGKRFVAAVSPNRSRALSEAGSSVGIVEQPEYFRVLAVTPAGARVRTTLTGDQGAFELSGRGAFRTLTATRDFMVDSDQPVMLASVSPSQEAAGIPRPLPGRASLPGGDPSLLIIPPVEQFRANYVFLTPDKYSFDFIRVIAEPGTTVRLDGVPLSQVTGCTTAPGDGLTPAERGEPDPPFVVHRCQLSFPVIDPFDSGEVVVRPGRQNDGVHILEANGRVGLLVDGFDAFVSYAYAGGTELEEIVTF
ncbi:MAG TPA: IgGFc-binding protein [Polyangiaceae bacterium]|nr:IgGFc-binding protein [Polyangiaceae bacterium]